MAAAATLAVAVTACADDAPDRAGPPTCGDESGRIAEIDLDLDAPGFTDRPALVLLPPCYDHDIGVYPTVYLLHGAGMSPSSFTSQPIRAAATLDRLVVSGEIQPLIVVLPPRATMFPGFGDEILDPLIAEVDDRYRSIESPDARGIGGFSAGGPPTVESAFTGEPRVAAVGLFAAVWSDSLGPLAIDGSADRDDLPAVLAEAGDRDSLNRRLPAIAAVMEEVGASSTERIVPGAHDLNYVADRLDDWLIWFDDELSP